MSVKRRAMILLAAALMALGIAVTTAEPALASTYVSGSVSCVTGRNVEGVFVHANSGGGGWGIMNVPGNTSSTVYWHYTLPNNGSYYLAVGCGGGTEGWDSTNYSNNYSAGTGSLMCYDLAYTAVPSYSYRCV